MSRRKLAPCVRLDLEYVDRTPFGSVVSGRIDALIATAAAKVLARTGRAAQAELGADVFAGLEALLSNGELGSLFERTGKLRSQCLYPPASRVTPAALRVRAARAAPGRRVPLAHPLAAELASWLGEWQRGSEPPRPASARRLWDELCEAGALVDEREPAPLVPPGITFLGHAAVLVATETTRVVIDPFLVPPDARDAAESRPLALEAIAPDAVLISHSHEDHFHLGSLLRFGPDVLLVVPCVARESLLAIDMAYRLRELGFRNVQTLGWGQKLTVGDVAVEALPMYGEQPTTRDVYHPEVRNQGNTYVVEAAGRRYAFSVDAGQDREGDMRQVAAAAALASGPIDVLFGGFRSWSLYPVQYLNPVFARYFLFVPRAAWAIRQKIMNDADDLIDTAESFGASVVVPYANGGAPWFHELGLGPPGRDAAASDVHFNPRPEHVAACAGRRSSTLEGPVASPVAVRVLRPGGALGSAAEAPLPAAAAPGLAEAAADAASVAWQQALLRVLVARAPGLLAAPVGVGDAQRCADAVRRAMGLNGRAEMHRWLQDSGLTPADFSSLALEWAAVERAAAEHAEALSARLPAQAAFRAALRQASLGGVP